MGRLNFLIEGVSGTGKTSVCYELRQRGMQAFNGDRDLAYQGNPETGEPHLGRPKHEHHIWRVGQVRALAADTSEPFTFFCGGSRNFSQFVDVFDEVYVLTVDVATLQHRLASRPEGEFGHAPEELDLVLRLHATGSDLPREATAIDATRPLSQVVDEIIQRATAHTSRSPN